MSPVVLSGSIESYSPLIFSNFPLLTASISSSRLTYSLALHCITSLVPLSTKAVRNSTGRIPVSEPSESDSSPMLLTWLRCSTIRLWISLLFWLRLSRKTLNVDGVIRLPVTSYYSYLEKSSLLTSSQSFYCLGVKVILLFHS